MKRIVSNVVVAISIRDVSRYAIIGGVNTSNNHKCFVQERDDMFFTTSIKPDDRDTPSYWDARKFKSVKEMVDTISEKTVEWYVFDTQRELLEWLLK